MEPKSTTAAASLTNLSNAINSGIPIESPFAATTNRTYTPPNVGRVVPPSPSPLVPAQHASELPQAPVASAALIPPGMTSQIPDIPSQPFSSSVSLGGVAREAQKTPTGSFAAQPLQPVGSQPPQDHMQSPIHTVPAPAQQGPSRTVSGIIVAFVGTLVILTGVLYVYGSFLVAKQQKSQATDVPAGGFQVTESAVTQPNFDQRAEFSTPYRSTDPAVNTDPAQMFTE